MTKNKRQITQTVLLIFGIVLIFLTYFTSPIKQQKKSSLVQKEEMMEESVDENKENIFKNITYTGFDTNGNNFEINAELAEIRKNEPDLTYMFNVTAYFYLSKNKTIIVTSEKGIYNRSTSDIFFEKNINLKEGDNILFAQNIDVLMSENSIIAYNDIKFNGFDSSALADKITIDLLNKTSKMSMFDSEKKVRIKLIK